MFESYHFVLVSKTSSFSYSILLQLLGLVQQRVFDVSSQWICICSCMPFVWLTITYSIGYGCLAPHVCIDHTNTQTEYHNDLSDMITTVCVPYTWNSISDDKR